MTKVNPILICLASVALVFALACGISAPPQGKLSEVEELYDQEQYENAMNVARFNLNKNSDDLASSTTVWKVQLIQGTKSIDYTQQFFFQAKDLVTKAGPGVVPFLGRALGKDPYNTVRLFSVYCLGLFDDSLSTGYIKKVFTPDYTLGEKASNVTLEFLRAEAGQILAERKVGEVFDGIAALAADKDPEIKVKAATALGFLADPRGIPVLEQMMKEVKNDPEIGWLAELADSSIAKIKRAQ